MTLNVSTSALVEALRKRSRSVISTVEGKAVYLLEAAADTIEAIIAEQTEAGERVQHHATVFAYSARPDDESLTLAVECLQCPPIAGQPNRWGHLTDSRDNHRFLLDEAAQHNADHPGGRS